MTDTDHRSTGKRQAAEGTDEAKKMGKEKDMGRGFQRWRLGQSTEWLSKSGHRPDEKTKKGSEQAVS